VDHRQVQRAEVLVEWEVGQIVVDVEKESVLEICWRFCVANPVKFISNDFNGFSQSVFFLWRFVGHRLVSWIALSWLLKRRAQRRAVLVPDFLAWGSWNVVLI